MGKGCSGKKKHERLATITYDDFYEIKNFLYELRTTCTLLIYFFEKAVGSISPDEPTSDFNVSFGRDKATGRFSAFRTESSCVFPEEIAEAIFSKLCSIYSEGLRISKEHLVFAN